MKKIAKINSLNLNLILHIIYIFKLLKAAFNQFMVIFTCYQNTLFNAFHKYIYCINKILVSFHVA